MKPIVMGSLLGLFVVLIFIMATGCTQVESPIERGERLTHAARFDSSVCQGELVFQHKGTGYDKVWCRVPVK